jgi:hypothetical protein
MNTAEQIWNDLIDEIKQSFAQRIIPSSISGEYFKK